MKTITITAQMITAATAIALSNKLDITTINAKGAERTGSEQAKQLKRMLKKDGLSYVEEVKVPTLAKDKITTRKGKVTNATLIRGLIASNPKSNLDELVVLLRESAIDVPNNKLRSALQYNLKRVERAEAA